MVSFGAVGVGGCTGSIGFTITTGVTLVSFTDTLWLSPLFNVNVKFSEPSVILSAMNFTANDALPFASTTKLLVFKPPNTSAFEIVPPKLNGISVLSATFSVANLNVTVSPSFALVLSTLNA